MGGFELPLVTGAGGRGDTRGKGRVGTEPIRRCSWKPEGRKHNGLNQAGVSGAGEKPILGLFGRWGPQGDVADVSAVKGQ